jgi:hypothetical protein
VILHDDPQYSLGKLLSIVYHYLYSVHRYSAELGITNGQLNPGSFSPTNAGRDLALGGRRQGTPSEKDVARPERRVPHSAKVLGPPLQIFKG